MAHGIQSYGKGAVVGLNGEVERAEAMLADYVRRYNAQLRRVEEKPGYAIWRNAVVPGLLSTFPGPQGCVDRSLSLRRHDDHDPRCAPARRNRDYVRFQLAAGRLKSPDRWP